MEFRRLPRRSSWWRHGGHPGNDSICKSLHNVNRTHHAGVDIVSSCSLRTGMWGRPSCHRHHHHLTRRIHQMHQERAPARRRRRCYGRRTCWSTRDRSASSSHQLDSGGAGADNRCMDSQSYLVRGCGEGAVGQERLLEVAFSSEAPLFVGNASNIPGNPLYLNRSPRI